MNNSFTYDTARTRTSVSDVWIIICLCPWFTASVTCKRIQESASSWEHGAMVLKSARLGEQKTLVSCVLYTSFPYTCIRAIWSASRANNPVLFSFTRKKLCQFPGMVVDNVTLRRSPDPRLVRAPDLRLLDLYTSQTISTQCTAVSFLLMYGIKTVSTYSRKVVDVPVPSIWTINVPSSTATSTWGDSRGGVDSSARHCRSQTWCLSAAHHTVRGRVARADFHVWKSSGGHHHGFGLR